MTTATDTTTFHSLLRDVFPVWSSNRISRWLRINPRTVQRMLKPDGEKNSQAVPQPLFDRISEMNQRVHAFDPAKRFDAFVQEAREAGLDDEVIAAWIAASYEKLMNRSLD